MLSPKITIIILLFCFIIFHHTDAWSRRRRRRCTPQACEVSSWSYWSSCNANDQCGQQGSQRRTRTEVSPSSCGGTECPELEETRQCYGSRSVDCRLSLWSEWSACTSPCGVSGTQSSSRHRIITEKCGGRCASTFRKTRACLEFSCLNGGSLEDKTCFCKKGFSGSCCEKKPSSEKLSTGAIVGIVFTCVAAIAGITVGIVWWCVFDCKCSCRCLGGWRVDIQQSWPNPTMAWVKR